MESKLNNVMLFLEKLWEQEFQSGIIDLIRKDILDNYALEKACKCEIECKCDRYNDHKYIQYTKPDSDELKICDSYYYTSIEAFIIPDTIVSIGENCFANWRIKYIVFPSSLKIIGEGAFYNCINLKLSSFSFPVNLEIIRKGAFEECLFKEVIIPRKLKLLKKWLSGCYRYISINIPESVKVGDFTLIQS